MWVLWVFPWLFTIHLKTCLYEWWFKKKRNFGEWLLENFLPLKWCRTSRTISKFLDKLNSKLIHDEDRARGEACLLACVLFEVELESFKESVLLVSSLKLVSTSIFHCHLRWSTFYYQLRCQPHLRGFQDPVSQIRTYKLHCLFETVSLIK